MTHSHQSINVVHIGQGKLFSVALMTTKKKKTSNQSELKPKVIKLLVSFKNVYVYKDVIATVVSSPFEFLNIVFTYFLLLIQ